MRAREGMKDGEMMAEMELERAVARLTAEKEQQEDIAALS